MGALQDHQLEMYEKYGDVALSAWSIVNTYPAMTKEAVLNKVLETGMLVELAEETVRNEVFLEICEIIQPGSSAYTLDALEYMEAFDRGFNDQDQAEAEMWSKAEAQMTKAEFEHVTGKCAFIYSCEAKDQ